MNECDIVTCPEGYYCNTHECYCDENIGCPYQRIAELAADNERLENIVASGIHTCSATCTRPLCVLRRENRILREALAEKQE